MRQTRIHKRSAGLLAIAMASVFMAAGGPANANAHETGVLMAPFARVATFAERPPQTVEEALAEPTAVSMVMTPEGNVVYWDGLSGLAKSNGPLPLDAGRSGQAPDRSYLLVLDDQDTAGWQLGTPYWYATTPGANGGSNQNLFCGDQRLLKTGEVMVAGGTIYQTEGYADLPNEVADPEAGAPDGLAELWGSKHTRLFTDTGNNVANADGGSWSWDGNMETGEAPSDMEFGRWYPTLITLSDGTPIVVGGVTKLLWNSNLLPGAEGRATGPLPENVPQIEVYDRETNSWDTLPETANRDLPLFPRLHLLTNGDVFYGGVGQMWGPAGESINELSWGTPAIFDPNTNTWTELPAEPTSALFDAKSGAFSVPLMFEPDANGAYTTTRILVGGGVLGTAPGTYLAQNESEILTVTEGADGAMTLSRTTTEPLNYDRWYSSSVLLPTGEVLAINGADKDEVIQPGTENAVRMLELFDPVSGTWRELQETARDRTYHNSAILLPDGSVLIGGHSPINQLYGPESSNSPPLGANNFRDPSFEIFKPPYLFNEDGSEKPRPLLVANSTNIDDEGVLHFNMHKDSTIEPTSVVLTRVPTTTHITDADMRGVRLPGSPVPTSDPQTPGTDPYKMALPDDPDVLAPGYYYVWVSGETGAPSVAQIVLID